MTCEIINTIRGIENLSYLELGINDNSNYDLILCRKKMSVDLNGNAVYTGTTDNFFEFIRGSGIMFDIIFIDANHDYEYALRDLNNSRLHAKRWIIMHDMLPREKHLVISNRCSDSYKILYHLLSTGVGGVYPLNDECGTTFIKVPLHEVVPDKKVETLIWEDYIDFISTRKLYSQGELIEILSRYTF